MTKNQKTTDPAEPSAPLVQQSPHVAAPGVDAAQALVVPRRAGEQEAWIAPTDASKSAADLLAGFAKVQTQLADEVSANESGYQHYVRCYRPHKEPAIYLTRHPGSDVLGNQDWFATYKERGAPYHRSAYLYCQHCAKFNQDGEYEGELFQLAGITYLPTKKHNEVLFTVAPRYVMRYAGDGEQFKKDGGAHRATSMSQPLMNLGLPESVRRREVVRG